MIADAVFLCDYLRKAYYLKIKLLVLKDNIKIRIYLLEHMARVELNNRKEMYLHDVLATTIRGHENLWSNPIISFHSHSHKQAGKMDPAKA